MKKKKKKSISRFAMTPSSKYAFISFLSAKAYLIHKEERYMLL